MKNKISLVLVLLLAFCARAFADDDTGSIHVTVYPSTISGVSVYIDGSFKGTAPLTVNNLKPGTHTVRVSKAGFPDESTSAYVSKGRTTNVYLTLKTSEIYVNVINTPGATVYIDNRSVGTAPVTARDLAPGSHNIRIEKTHYETIKETVYVAAGYRHSLTVEMVKISGYLRVNVTPSNASVTCGGTSISGTTEIDEGRYNVRARLFGYEEYNGSVLIERNKTHTMTISLDKAAFRISSLEADTQGFNPDEKKSGAIYFKWSVSAPESGVITLRDSKNSVVWTNGTAFTTWNQYVEWDGKVGGSLIPDGKYTATLTAGGLSRSTTLEIKSKRTAAAINAELGAARVAIQKEIDEMNKGKSSGGGSYVDLEPYQTGRRGIFADAAYMAGPVYNAFYTGAEFDWHGDIDKSNAWKHLYFGADAGAGFASVPSEWEPETDSFIIFDAHALIGVTGSLKNMRLYFSTGAGFYGLSAGTGGFSFEAKLGAEYKISKFSAGACYAVKGYAGAAWADVIGLNFGFNF